MSCVCRNRFIVLLRIRVTEVIRPGSLFWHIPSTQWCDWCIIIKSVLVEFGFQLCHSTGSWWHNQLVGKNSITLLSQTIAYKCMNLWKIQYVLMPPPPPLFFWDPSVMWIWFQVFSVAKNILNCSEDWLLLSATTFTTNLNHYSELKTCCCPD